MTWWNKYPAGKDSWINIESTQKQFIHVGSLLMQCNLPAGKVFVLVIYDDYSSNIIEIDPGTVGCWVIVLEVGRMYINSTNKILLKVVEL